MTSSLDAGDVGRMTALTFIVIGSIGLVARLITLPLGLDRQTVSAFLIVVMFSNSGNYGLPVVLFAFGNDALAHAAECYFVANAVATYSLGVFIASAGRKSVAQAAAGIIRVPAVWGAVAAVVMLGLGIQLPTPLMRPVELLAGAALPAMILVLGMQLERTGRPDRPGLVLPRPRLSLAVTPLVAAGACHVRRPVGGRPPGGHRAVRDAERGADHDPGAGIRRGAVVRHRVRHAVHARESDYGDAADRRDEVKGRWNGVVPGCSGVQSSALRISRECSAPAPPA